MSKAGSKLISARTALVLDEPFFGVLSLGLVLKADNTQPTAWTDGQSMGYNEEFIESLSPGEVKALLVHEVMHCAQGHPWRCEGRIHKRWNVAADKAINDLITLSGFQLPGDALQPTSEEVGKSAEWIYNRLLDSKDKDTHRFNNSQNGGVSDPSSFGEVRDALSDSDSISGESVVTESDWKDLVQQAVSQAKAYGKVSAQLDRFFTASVASKVNWRSVLRRFMSEHTKSDYTWHRPNRRYIASGLYLPSLESVSTGEIAIAIDTSGSMDDLSLSQAKSEVEAVIDECKPSAVTVYYADSKIKHTDRFEEGEQIQWCPRGGGGTSFVDVCQDVEKQDVPILCLVYITDLYGTFPTGCSVPVIWITTSSIVAPFGETIKIEN